MPKVPAFNGRKLFCQPVAKTVVFFELRSYEFDGEPGLGLNSFGCEQVGVSDLSPALAEVPRLDESFIKKALEDVIDLSQTNSSVLGELALVDDRLPVQGVEDFEGFLSVLHFITSHRKAEVPKNVQF